MARKDANVRELNHTEGFDHHASIAGSIIAKVSIGFMARGRITEHISYSTEQTF